MTHTAARPSELAIYEQMWTIGAYRHYSPGEVGLGEFLAVAKPVSGSCVFDMGCGTGRAALTLATLGFDVTAMDFASNCLDADVRDAVTAGELAFCVCDLTQPIGYVASYGICCDVMEHIPPDLVDSVLKHVLLAARFCWFDICTVPDSFGAMVGHPLHLSVHDAWWWRRALDGLDARILHMQVLPERVRIYCTGWVDNQALVDVGLVNTCDEQIRANVMHNTRQGWRAVEPRQAQPDV